MPISTLLSPLSILWLPFDLLPQVTQISPATFKFSVALISLLTIFVAIAVFATSATFVIHESDLDVDNQLLDPMEDLAAVDPLDALHLFVGQAGGVDVGQLGADVVEDVRRGPVQLVDLAVEDPLVGQGEESVRHCYHRQVHRVAFLH